MPQYPHDFNATFKRANAEKVVRFLNDMQECTLDRCLKCGKQKRGVSNVTYMCFECANKPTNRIELGSGPDGRTTSQS